MSIILPLGGPDGKPDDEGHGVEAWSLVCVTRKRLSTLWSSKPN